MLPEGSDKNFALRLALANKGDAYFSTHKVRVVDQFQVAHYAGKVNYEVTGFMEKNRNEVPQGLQGLMSTSAVCTRKVIPEQVEEKSIMGKRSKKKTSIGTEFKNELKQLMETLNGSFPHFIRCFKPNGLQKPDKYDASLISEQLRYTGVQAVLEIRQQEYPFRFNHKKFYHRFKIVSLDREEEKIMNSLDGKAHRVTMQNFFQRLTGEGIEGGWAVGRTKVLLRTRTQEALEQQRKNKIHSSIAKVQGRRRMPGCQARVAALRGGAAKLGRPC